MTILSFLLSDPHWSRAILWTTFCCAWRRRLKQYARFRKVSGGDSPHRCQKDRVECLFMRIWMKRFFYFLTVLGLLSVSGCVIREGRGGDRDHYWHGEGHEEHWDGEHWH